MNSHHKSKLDYDGVRLAIASEDASAKIVSILQKLGCRHSVCIEVAHHLVDASLCGVESHGVMRILEYARQYQSGYLTSTATPEFVEEPEGVWHVSGRGGIGIPAMQMAMDHAIHHAQQHGISAIGVKDVGHTGRHGAFAETAAQHGCLSFIIGGGNRKKWRQVAPHGGTKPLLPTNPWCVGIPGGDNGPVVLDFATSKIAGGWIYAARSAGAQLPAGCVIDKNGNPTTNPNDYFDGGAILPAGEHKGYALAVMAELIAEAMLGPTQTECHWLIITLDTTRYKPAHQMRAAAEDILSELRTCPPAPQSSGVQIPGERERAQYRVSDGIIQMPEQTWTHICALETELNEGE